MILIFPFAAIADGKPSPKNYAYWPAVVQSLRSLGQGTHQISRSGEPDIGCDTRSNDLSLDEIKEWLRNCKTWVSVDSFAQHLAWSIGEPGVVIFNKSDPEIFGHSENLNLLKGKNYLRIHQYWLWSQEDPYPESCIAPEKVVEAIRLSIERRKK